MRTAKLKQKQIELENEIQRATKKINEQKNEVLQQKEMLEFAHKEIIDSIKYAKRIQEAHLPSDQRINKIITRMKK
jgi:hypothetical protein